MNVTRFENENKVKRWKTPQKFETFVRSLFFFRFAAQLRWETDTDFKKKTNKRERELSIA